MENKHDSELKELIALRLTSRCSRSITTLEAQRKLVTKEYAERIKKIRAVILMVQQRETMGQLSLMGMDDIEINDDLNSLIYFPTKGLMEQK